MSGYEELPADLRLDVEGRVFQAATRTALYAIMHELRRIRRALLLMDLLPPLGWFGKRSRLELAEDSHTKAADNLRRHLARIEEIRAANTQAPAKPTAEVAFSDEDRRSRAENSQPAAPTPTTDSE